MSNFSAKPTKLPSNQFDHFYKGGYRIGKLRNGPGGPMRPEEWIGSTTTRFGETENGLSKLPSGKLLKDEINSDPTSWLGQKHLEKFGTSTEVLVKLLDPDQRLPVHYHPDQKFAKEKLQLNHGKTEAWIVLDAPAGARVGVGFKESMKKNQVAQLVKDHDSTGLLNSLEFKNVRQGMQSLCRLGCHMQLRPESLCWSYRSQLIFQSYWNGMALQLMATKMDI